MESISCGWRGSLRELKDVYIKLQASLADLHKGETDIYVNHHGPYALYEKFGFELHKDMKQDSVARKYLSPQR